MTASKKSDAGEHYPVLVLPETVLFPRMTMELVVREERECLLADDLAAGPAPAGGEGRRLVLSLCQWDSPYPDEARPNPVGTLAELLEAGGVGFERTVRVRGIERVELGEAVRQAPYLVVRVQRLEQGAWARAVPGPEFEGDVEALRRQAQALAFFKEGARGDTALTTVEWIKDAGVLADYVAHHFITDWYLKQELLEMVDPAERVRTLLDVLRPEGGPGRVKGEG